MHFAASTADDGRIRVRTQIVFGELQPAAGNAAIAVNELDIAEVGMQFDQSAETGITSTPRRERPLHLESYHDTPCCSGRFDAAVGGAGIDIRDGHVGRFHAVQTRNQPLTFVAAYDHNPQLRLICHVM